MNNFDIYNITDFWIFILIILRSIEIMIELNF